MTPRPSMLRRLLLPFIALALVSSCAGKKAGGQAGFKMPPMPVEVAEVRPQTVRDEFHALGTIESDEIIQVVSELNALVVAIPFREGGPVARGTLIARLDDREIKADADRAEALSEQAAANAKRAEKLFETSAISSQELDNSRATSKVARANEAVAKARLAKTRIVAPFAGVVGTRRVSPGAYLKSGDVITDLARVDDMKVTFSAPERFLGEMQRNDVVTITTPAYPDQAFAGRVSVVNPMVDPSTRTVQFVARIPNRGGKLRPGMSANVAVTFSERASALTVPDEAVFAEGNQSFVYVVKPDSTVTRTAIMLGTRDSARVEVVSGLESGAVVVRAGHQKLFDGAKVMPVPAGDASAPGAGGPAGAKTEGGPAKSDKSGEVATRTSNGSGKKTR
jgi:membrane fusion protein, multidrug efflux system